jgi:hypothetical protein
MTSYPFLSIAKQFGVDYGEVVRHAHWYYKSFGLREPHSTLSVSCKFAIEYELRKPICERGNNLPSIV